jgi:hypothetical protein
LPTEYYSASKGYFTRADVVYLRQDFSAVHRVPNQQHWPEIQRFDYFVRIKPLAENKAKQLLSAWDDKEYRRYVQFALDQIAQN